MSDMNAKENMVAETQVQTQAKAAEASAKTAEDASKIARTTVKPATKIEPAGKKKTQENVMYLGPTIAGKVKQGTIFKGGILPATVQECVAQFPAMTKLFVPVSKLPEATKALNKKQGVLAAIYAQTASKF